MMSIAYVSMVYLQLESERGDGRALQELLIIQLIEIYLLLKQVYDEEQHFSESSRP